MIKWIRQNIFIAAGRHAGAWRIAVPLVMLGAALGTVPLAAAPLSNLSSEYQVKAAFLYKFCLYVEWPEVAFTSADSPLVLGVAGPDQLVRNLEAVVRDRTIQGHPLQVHRINPDKDALDTVHLLFLGRFRSTKHLQRLPHQHPVLIVTESSDGLEAGGGINLVLDDNRIRFDINLASTSQRGLNLSAQLLKAARRVEGEMH